MDNPIESVERVEEARSLKQPQREPQRGPAPEVVERVSEMLLRIEREGMDAVRAYSQELDDWSPQDFQVSSREIEEAERSVDEKLREHLEYGRNQVQAFAELQRDTLVDFERETAPGVVLGQRQVPVSAVGAYLPAGRVPLLASPFMTVLVPKMAGVEHVVACAPPKGEQGIFPPMVYTATISGADAIFAVGGVQAVAAMAFGLIDGMAPADIVVGAGNPFVQEAKRQLYGRVGIDLIAGPSEIAVIADESADVELVAADLLGQAEHGPTSPSTLITTSEHFGQSVLDEIDRQLESLPTAEVVATAWRDCGSVIVAEDREAAVAISDELAPEHLEVHTEEDDWYLQCLRNYGSLFLGMRSTVAYADKGMTGTNHVLPTGGAARYTGGLSVARFTKTLTYQRVTSDEGTQRLAPPVIAVSQTEELAAHEATAARRLERLGSEKV